jgi:hypothetical protein
VVALPYGDVSVDGVRAGASPITLSLAPGSYRISAHSEGGTLEKRVTVIAGERKQVLLR